MDKARLGDRMNILKILYIIGVKKNDTTRYSKNLV